MKNETSAGIVVYHYDDDTGEREYLLLHYLGGHWDLPKGKIEDGESLKDAAIRETKEETGLDVEPEGTFEQALSYYFKDRRGNVVNKTVTFFVGRADSKTVSVSNEHLTYLWLPYELAKKKITYDNARRLLSMANQYLETRRD